MADRPWIDLLIGGRRYVLIGATAYPIDARELVLENLPHLTALPPDFANLETLQVTGCPLFEGAPEGLPALASLAVDNCPRFAGGGPPGLRLLAVRGCEAFERVPEAMAGSLRSLCVSACPRFRGLQGGFGALEDLMVEGCPGVGGFPGGLPALRRLFVDDPRLLASAPASTTHLVIHGVRARHAIPAHLARLARLHVGGNGALPDPPPAGFAGELRVTECEDFEDLPEACAGISGLEVERCERFAAAPARARGLRWLRVADCPAFESVPAGLAALERLTVERCPRFRAVPGGLRGLRALRVSGCPAFAEIGPGVPPEARVEIEGADVRRALARSRLDVLALRQVERQVRGPPSDLWRKVGEWLDGVGAPREGGEGGA